MSQRKTRYWDGKFVALNAILLLLAAIAAYLEYSVYPAIMTQSFGETGLRSAAIGSHFQVECRKLPYRKLYPDSGCISARLFSNIRARPSSREPLTLPWTKENQGGDLISVTCPKRQRAQIAKRTVRLLSQSCNVTGPCFRRRSTSHAQRLLRKSF